MASSINQVVENFRNSANCGDDEVRLFRKFAQSIIATPKTKAVYIEETHGAHKANVRYFSQVHKVETRCEIADLLLVVVHPRYGIKATFLQAKKRNNGAKYKWKAPTVCESPPMFDFKGQFNQWELLAAQRDIRGVGSFNPPSNLLSGAASCAIGSIGIFYCDKYDNVEIIHSIAKYVSASTKSGRKVSGQTKMLANLMLRDVYVLPALYAPYAGSSAIVTTSMHEFVTRLFHGFIGSPVCFSSLEMDARGCTSYRENDIWVLDYVDMKLKAAQAIRQDDSIINNLEGRNIDSRYYHAGEIDLPSNSRGMDILVVWSRHGIDDVE